MESRKVVAVDRDTPLFRNEWYVAARAEEVTRKPIHRVILDEDIVLYRRENGEAVVLQNRCAHRSFPLSEGFLIGDRIVCGYHGFQYGPDGRCALAPALGKGVAAIRIQPYPVVEQGPFVWIWTGTGEADYSRFVEQPWFTEPGWKSVSGYFHMKANYLGLHENLLDLSHFPFLHGAAIGKPHHAEAKLHVRVENESLYCSVMHEDAPLPPSIVAAENLQPPFNRLANQQISSPAVHIGKTFNTDSSQPQKSFNRQVIHCMTPESRTSTHYFWAMARDVALDSAEVDADLIAIGTKAYDEDRLALEQIEELVARDRRPAFKEKIIASDTAGVQLLRLFAKRFEANESQDAAVAA